MKQINIQPSLSKYNRLSWIEIRPTNHYWEVGEKYILRNQNNDNMVGKAVIVEKQALTLDQITNWHSFCAEDCDADTLRLILEMKYKTYVDGTFDFIVFSKNAREMAHYDGTM